MKKLLLWSLVVVVPALGIFLGTRVDVDTPKQNKPSADPAVSTDQAKVEYDSIAWKDLRSSDPQAEETTTVASLHNKNVMIQGFVVPLDDEAETYNEFLLVPTVQACIHVPPPPSNQMILVQMDAEKAPKRSSKPVWIKGVLQAVRTENPFGIVVYKMYGHAAEEGSVP
jgi:uncharacterized protein